MPIDIVLPRLNSYKLCSIFAWGSKCKLSIIYSDGLLEFTYFDSGFDTQPAVSAVSMRQISTIGVFFILKTPYTYPVNMFTLFPEYLFPVSGFGTENALNATAQFQLEFPKYSQQLLDSR